VPDLSTAQIIGGVAAVVVIVLILTAVVVSRRRRAHRAEDEPQASFLGSTPQDTFAGLGAAERPTEPADDELRLDWGQNSATVDDETTLGGARQADDRAPGPEASLEAGPAAAATVGPGEKPEDRSEVAEAEGQSEATETEEVPTDLLAAEAAETPEARTDVPPAEAADLEEAWAAAPAAAATEAGPSAEEAGPIEGDADTAAAEPPGEPPPQRMVPLSDVIVTTNRKLVDLGDSEVRRMLTELVRYEIDQAAEFSAAGQSVDAVLQLTEAEKVSRALDMDETAERIRAMMRELQD